MINSDSLWKEVAKGVSATPGCRLEDLRDFLTAQENPHAQLLSARQLDAEANESSARALEFAILSQVQFNHISRHQAAQWLRWILAALKRVPNYRIGQSEDLPPHPTRLAILRRPQTSPFCPAATTLSTQALIWENSLMAWLQSLYQRDLEPLEWSAGLVLSSVLIGGLLDAQKIRNLLQQVVSPLPTTGLRPYAEFHQRLGSYGDFHCQRWFLDPVSEMLLMRRPTGFAPPPQKTLIQAISSLLITHAQAALEPPKSLDKLVLHGVARWAQQGAQIDIEVMRRRVTAHAIHERTWKRLFSQAVIGQPSVSNYVESADAVPEHDLSADFDLLHPWFVCLRQALDVPAKTAPDQVKLLEHLKGAGFLMEALPPSYRILVEWVQALLSGKNSTHDRLAVSTIRQLSETVIPAVAARLGDTDLLELAPDDFVELYEELMSCASATERIHLAKGLRELHHHLVRTHGIKRLKSIRDTLGEDAGLEPVDANPISAEEYLKARAYLEQQIRRGGDRDLLQIAKLVMMLAFRTGMRRREAMGLLLDDVHGASRLEILVRPHAERRLKTTASRRIIPAGWLIPLAERRELLSWISRRRLADPVESGSKWVFEVQSPSGEWRRLSDETTAARIIEALTHATGQPTKIHQLRHAFATWLYLGLRVPDYPHALGMLDHLPATRALVRRGARLRRLLLNQPGSTSRSYAYTVARLLGHSSPMVSMNSYIHSTEFIQRAVSIRKAGQLPPASLRGVADLKPVWGNRLLGNGIEYLMDHLRWQVARAADNAELSLDHTGINDDVIGNLSVTPFIAKRGRPKKLAPSDWVELMAVHELLHIYSTTQLSLVNICGSMGLDVLIGQRIVDRAVQYGETLGFKCSGVRPLAFPDFVRTKSASEAASAIEKRLARAFAKDPATALEGVANHLQHYNPSKRDVVFRGEKDGKALQKYVALLNLMEFSCDDVQIVLRTASVRSVPPWSKRLLGPYRASAVNCNRPPVPSKADSYKNWVGLRLVSADQIGWPSVSRVMMYLAFVSWFTA